MLILLPPSEGKTQGTGAPLKLASLSFAETLGAPRKELLRAVERLCGGPKAKALNVLGISTSMAPLLARNANLSKEPTSPAIEVYSGVLFEALDWTGLSARAKKRGEDAVLISSALFGVVRPLDRIPAYRLSMDVSLPVLGALAPLWRPSLNKALNSMASDLIVDCRSSAYAASWAPPRELTYSVKVMVEKSGKRTVVSHMAKQARGDLARLLLSAPRAAKTIDDVAEIASSNYDVEVDSATSQRSGVITLISAG